MAHDTLPPGTTTKTHTYANPGTYNVEVSQTGGSEIVTGHGTITIGGGEEEGGAAPQVMAAVYFGNENEPDTPMGLIPGAPSHGSSNEPGDVLNVVFGQPPTDFPPEGPPTVSFADMGVLTADQLVAAGVIAKRDSDGLSSLDPLTDPLVFVIDRDDPQPVALGLYSDEAGTVAVWEGSYTWDVREPPPFKVWHFIQDNDPAQRRLLGRPPVADSSSAVIWQVYTAGEPPDLLGLSNLLTGDDMAALGITHLDDAPYDGTTMSATVDWGTAQMRWQGAPGNVFGWVLWGDAERTVPMGDTRRQTYGPIKPPHVLPDPSTITGGLYREEESLFVRHDERPWPLGATEQMIVHLWPGPSPDSVDAMAVQGMETNAVSLGDVAAFGPYMAVTIDGGAPGTAQGPGGFDCTMYAWGGPYDAYAGYPVYMLTGGLPVADGDHTWKIGIYNDQACTQVVYEYEVTYDYTYDPVANPVSFGWYADEHKPVTEGDWYKQAPLVTSGVELTATTWGLSLWPLWGDDPLPYTDHETETYLRAGDLGLIGVRSVRDADGVKTVAEKWQNPGAKAVLDVGSLGTGGTKTLGYYRNADGTDPFYEETFTWTTAPKFEGWTTFTAHMGYIYGATRGATFALNGTDFVCCPYQGTLAQDAFDTNDPNIVTLDELGRMKVSGAWRVRINYSTPYDSGIVNDASYWNSFFVHTAALPVTEVGDFVATYELFEGNPDLNSTGYAPDPVDPPVVVATWDLPFTVTP